MIEEVISVFSNKSPYILVYRKTKSWYSVLSINNSHIFVSIFIQVRNSIVKTNLLAVTYMRHSVYTNHIILRISQETPHRANRDIADVSPTARLPREREATQLRGCSHGEKVRPSSRRRGQPIAEQKVIFLNSCFF